MQSFVRAFELGDVWGALGLILQNCEMLHGEVYIHLQLINMVPAGPHKFILYTWGFHSGLWKGWPVLIIQHQPFQ
jgi:hypothetical protein